MIHQILFELAYVFKQTPWDTGITPPELWAFLDSHPPGRALDLGCGTGTNAITMAQHGWQVVAVDLSRLAIQQARKKARRAGLSIDFLHKNVTELDIIQGTFDLVLDIGCFHGLTAKARARYATNLKHFIKPRGTFLLYTWITDENDRQATPPNEAEIYDLLSPDFERRDVSYGTDRQRVSAWFTFQRKTK